MNDNHDTDSFYGFTVLPKCHSEAHLVENQVVRRDGFGRQELQLAQRPTVRVGMSPVESWVLLTLVCISVVAAFLAIMVDHRDVPSVKDERYAEDLRRWNEDHH